MPVGAVLVQDLYTDIPYEGASNSATVTLNFAPTLVVATSSIAIYQHQVNALGSYFFGIATIDSYQTSQGGVIQSVSPVLTSNDVVSITFYLAIAVTDVPASEVTLNNAVTGTFMVQGFD